MSSIRDIRCVAQICLLYESYHEPCGNVSYMLRAPQLGQIAVSAHIPIEENSWRSMQYWISFAASSASVVNRLVREQLVPSCSPTTFWFFHIYRLFLTLMFFQPSIHSKWASHGITLVCLVSLFVVTPLVLAYSALAYWIFRGKTPEQGWEA